MQKHIGLIPSDEADKLYSYPTLPAKDTTDTGLFLAGNGTFVKPTVEADLSAADRQKLDGIESGAQKNTITGIKGNAETTYRTGNVNLTVANIGAAAANHNHDSSYAAKSHSHSEYASTSHNHDSSYAAKSHGHAASDITSGTLSVARGGTGQTSLANVSVGSAGVATKASQDESGNNIKSNYAAAIDIADHTITIKNKNGTSLGTVTVPDADTTYDIATTLAAGLMSKDDKIKLNGIAAGAQVNTVTGVKGNSESSYRTGNVNITAANVGAAASSHTHSGYAASSHNHAAGDINSGTLAVARGGTGKSDLNNVTVGGASVADSLAGTRTLNAVNLNVAGNNKIHGICYTDADVAEKTVTINGFNPSIASVVLILFTKANTAANPTLSINGSAALPIIRYGNQNWKTKHITDLDNQSVWIHWAGSFARIIEGAMPAFTGAVVSGQPTIDAEYKRTIPMSFNSSYTASTVAAGLMSADDKKKLNGIAAGAQVNTVTGVKGNSESSYRTGNVNITAANVGAAASSHTHSEYAASNHTHSGYAATSHGNHVPATQTANNATFLRNDNSWQKVTPANIGAATSDHSHSGYAASSHTHGAGDITSGTFPFNIAASSCMAPWSALFSSSTAAGTQTKVGTAGGINTQNFVLQKSVFFIFHLTTTNTAANPKLNLSGTGALPIKYYNLSGTLTQVPAALLVAGTYFMRVDASAAGYIILWGPPAFTKAVLGI